jgi:GNAT superfamily N-acetyltransferase
MQALLDNVFWHAFTGAQRRFTAGTERARRYAAGFSAIAAFPDPQRPHFEDLRPFCDPADRLYTDGWTGPVPEGWTVEFEGPLLKMVWDGKPPPEDAAPVAVPMDARHAAQALELAKLTRPGPFGLRTIELGEYFGLFDGGRLVAMAGERTEAGAFREVSGVCTHPDAEGRGYARRLMMKVIARQLRREQVPFLHVMGGNARAVGLYERMGFRTYKASVVRVVAPAASQALSAARPAT